MADGQDGQVEVYSPKGERGTIPASQVGDAVSQGYKKADDYIHAIDPKTGNDGLIPKEQWGDAQKQGYILHPIEQARIQNNPAVLQNRLEAGIRSKASVVSPNALQGAQVGGMTQDQPMSESEQEQQGSDWATATKEGAPMMAGMIASEGATGLPLLARAGITAAAAGGTDLAMGAKPSEAATTGLTQGALPEVGGAAISKGGELLEKMAPAFIKNWLKPSEAMFSYGKDPVKFAEETFSKRGIPADKPEAAKMMFQELEDTGNRINSKLQAVEKMFPNAPNATKVDIGRAINDPIDKKIAEVSADRGMEASVKKGVIERLEDLRSGIMTNNAGKAQPTVVKMSTANQIKQQIGKGTNWKIASDPIEAKAQPIINGLRKEIYSNIRQGIENQAEQVGIKGLKEDNLHYGSGLDAIKSVEKKMNSGPMLTMSDLVTALASPAAAGVKKAIETTPGAIGAARASKSLGGAAKRGGAGVGQLLRLIAGMVESGGDTDGTGAPKQ
jgi:hypothetical protein